MEGKLGKVTRKWGESRLGDKEISIDCKAGRTVSHNRQLGQGRLRIRKVRKVVLFVGKLALDIACSWLPHVLCHP